MFKQEDNKNGSAINQELKANLNLLSEGAINKIMAYIKDAEPGSDLEQTVLTAMQDANVAESLIWMAGADQIAIDSVIGDADDVKAILKVLASQISSGKKKADTLNGFKSYMKNVYQAYALRKANDIQKGTFGARGAVELTEDMAQNLADDQDALGRKIRSLQSCISVSKKKGADYSRYQAQLDMLLPLRTGKSAGGAKSVKAKIEYVLQLNAEEFKPKAKLDMIQGVLDGKTPEGFEAYVIQQELNDTE